ncbi:hypothetical protein KUD97_03685 [Desulfovibrio desulfuricans]|uniref:hypothetical protein n=1 Tax=Desulfovibrio desulfuricans TaxID=876 RepID=UPI001F319CDB|nr:hypothetical protein [Desulfovibrio desulfuricans]UIB00765.1 hypothetical protein KUD97_03685 [Desulfovibrio desulfuricans]
MSNTELACLKKELGCKKLADLSDEQQAVIYKKILHKELSTKTVATIIKTVPTFVNGFVGLVKDISKAASESNAIAIKALETLEFVKLFLEPLTILAKKCKTPKECIAIAEIIQNLSFKICDTTIEIQKENNTVLREILAALSKFAPIAKLTLALLVGATVYALTPPKETHATPPNTKS